MYLNQKYQRLSFLDCETEKLLNLQRYVFFFCVGEHDFGNKICLELRSRVVSDRKLDVVNYHLTFPKNIEKNR